MVNQQPNPKLNCPKCGTPGSAWVNKCGKCGKKFTKQEIKVRQDTVDDKTIWIGCFGIAVVILVAGLFLFVPSPKEKAARSKLEAQEKRQAKHCVSPLDGSNYYVDAYVSARLRNPDSYEHIKTNTASVGIDGNHEFIVTYRAENGFGGKTSGMAVGKFSNANCQVVEAKLVAR